MTRKLRRNSALRLVVPLIAILLVSTAEASGPPPLFLSHVTYSSPGGVLPFSLAAADLNGDGKMDLVVANACAPQGSCGWTDGVVGVLLGNGDDTFQPTVSYDSGGPWAYSVAIADVNRDGIPDIVVANLQPTNPHGTVAVLLGNGDGTFQPAVVYDSGGGEAESVAVADLDGDGWPDLVVANCTANNNGECQSEGVVAVLLGNRDGTFKPAVTYDSGGNSAYSIAVADLNGDGKPDLVVANFGCCSESVGVLLGNGDGTFQPVATYYPGGQPTWIAIADVNGDGKPDLLAAIFGGVGVLLGNGDGTFKPAVTYGTGGSSGSIAAADLNGDGKLDLVAANFYTDNKKGTVGVLLGNGDGTFQAAQDYTLDAATSFALAADVTGDGRPELLAITPSKAQVAVLLNNTAPNATKTVVATSGSPSLLNQLVTFTATVRSTHGAIPNGEPVTFYDGTAEIGKGFTASGTVAFSTSLLSAKAHQITAVYAGDATSKPSTGSVKQIVDKYPTTTTLISSPNPSQSGQAVTFTVTVTSAGPTPTGKVKVMDGTAGIGTVTLHAGVATLTTSKLVVGIHPITATYLGDANNAKSVSPVLDQVVQ